MIDNDTKRLTRLTAILTQLQSKKLITANKLAEKYGVSNKTIYRDIKALENAGVPIVTQEGKGYSLMEGYQLPPIMFTEDEANGLITADLIIQSNKPSFCRSASMPVTTKGKLVSFSGSILMASGA